MDANLFEQSIIDDPYPVYTRIREAGRLVRNDLMKVWMVGHYEDVRRGLRDHEHLSSTVLADPDHDTSGQFQEGAPLIAVDPPSHTRLRSIVRELFTPPAIAAWQPRVHEIVEELLGGEAFRDTCASSDPIDILGLFTDPLPIYVISEMMDVPRSDRGIFKQWSHDVSNSAFAGEEADLKDGSLVERGRTAAREMAAYFADLISEREGHSGDDLVSLLLRANRDGTMGLGELTASLMLLIVAGNDTTTKTITSTILSLARHPDQREKLAGEPSLLNRAVEEAFRYDGPVHLLPRKAINGARIADQAIPDGDAVWLLLGAAHRDDGFFADAAHFDVARRPNQHLGLGHGIHACLGGHLARLEIREALSGLMARMPRFEFVSVEYAPNLAVRGPSSARITALG